MADATGGLRSFNATGNTDRPDEVWRLWTTPATWGDWDRGLASARLDGPFREGARGKIVDRAGRTSTFVVGEVEPGHRYGYHVALPGARLVLERTLHRDRPGQVRHDVAFRGPLALVWAVILGRGFRRQLPPTIAALLAAADPAAQR